LWGKGWKGLFERQDEDQDLPDAFKTREGKKDESGRYPEAGGDGGGQQLLKSSRRSKEVNEASKDRTTIGNLGLLINRFKGESGREAYAIQN